MNQRPFHFLMLVLLALPLVLFPFRNGAGQQFDANSAEKGVYRIVNFTEEGTGTGSGFLINDQGIVATNFHVIADYKRLLVVQKHTHAIRVWKCSVAFQSADKDIALLRVPGIEGNPTILCAEAPRRGADIYAVGFPGLADEAEERQAFFKALQKSDYGDLPLSDDYNNYVRPSIKGGNVEDIRVRRWGYPEWQSKLEAIQHNATISGGNSGGPLFDRYNLVVGINTSIKREGTASGEQLKYASTIATLRDILTSNNIAFQSAMPGDTGSQTVGPDKPAPPDPVVNNKDSTGGEGKTANGTGEIVAVTTNNNNNYLPIAIFAAAGLLGTIALVIALRRPADQTAAVADFQPPPPAPSPPPAAPVRSDPPRRQQPERYSGRGAGDRGRSNQRQATLSVEITGHSSSGQKIRQRLTENDFRSNSNRVRLGRDRKSCMVHLSEDSASRVHAEVRLSSDGSSLTLLDLGSANGTRLNKRKLKPKTPVAIDDGDSIRIGEYSLRVHVDRS